MRLRLGREQAPPRADDGGLRDLRVAAARAVPTWTELDGAALFPRARWLVHADTDALYKPVRGTVFAPGQARPTFGEESPLAFYVDGDGDLVLLERVTRPATWSEVVAAQTRREARRSAA